MMMVVPRRRGISAFVLLNDLQPALRSKNVAYLALLAERTRSALG